jgi:hypothetical protein
MKIKLEINQHDVNIYVLKNYMNIEGLEEQLNKYLKTGELNLKIGSSIYTIKREPLIKIDDINTKEDAIKARDLIVEHLEEVITQIKYIYNKNSWSVTGIYIF